MAIRLNNPNNQFADANGAPYSGGKLYFYESGTSTPLDTYSDNALSVANANPVVLDSAGRCGDVFLKGQAYKVVLKTSADVTVWTADPVTGNILTGPDTSVNGSVPSWSGTGGNTLAAGYAFKDEDNMASDSATAVASQQSIKAYVDGAPARGMNFADALVTRPVIKDYGETVNAIGSIGGGTQDIDLTLGNVVTGTVDTSETTFTFSNPPATGTAGSFTLILTNGGSQTVNWPASVDWAGGTAPSLTAAGRDVLTFFTVDGGTIWYGFSAGLDMS